MNGQFMKLFMCFGDSEVVFFLKIKNFETLAHQKDFAIKNEY
jgi:hypothetical protein